MVSTRTELSSPIAPKLIRSRCVRLMRMDSEWRGSLASIPIIDYRLYVDPSGDIHDSFRSFATRARLIASNGRADNQIMYAPRGRLSAGTSSIRSDDGFWLDNIARINPRFARRKSGAEQTGGTADACWTVRARRSSNRHRHKQTLQPVYPINVDPRIASGGPLADDVLKSLTD